MMSALLGTIWSVKKYQKFLALVPAATEWVCWSSEISGSKLREGLESKSAYSSFAHSLWALLIVKSMFHLLHTCGAFGKGGHTMSVQNPGITIDHWQYFLAYLTQCTEQPPKSDNLATRATLLIVKLLFHLVTTYFCLLSINFVSNFSFDLVKQNKHPRDATQAN